MYEVKVSVHFMVVVNDVPILIAINRVELKVYVPCITMIDVQ